MVEAGRLALSLASGDLVDKPLHIMDISHPEDIVTELREPVLLPEVSAVDLESVLVDAIVLVPTYLRFR